MHEIQKKVNALSEKIDELRNEIKKQLTKKQITFAPDDSLRKLIRLIPKKTLIISPIQLNISRIGHTAINVNDGVLFSGGNNLTSQQLYNVNTNTFTTKANLNPGRREHSGIDVNNNNILLNGGYPNDGSIQQLYNINSNTFTTKANLNPGRYCHTTININGVI